MPLVGQTVSLPLGEAVADDSRRRIQLFPPGEASPVPLEIAPNAERVTFGDTARSGTYWLRGLGSHAGFSANLPPEAIELERIDRVELDSILGPEGYTLARNREEIEFAENRASQRVSLHSPAILLALAAFVLEQILSNRFYRGRAQPIARPSGSTAPAG
jgi:hypothetical protein